MNDIISLKDAIRKLSYHHQMAAGWAHLAQEISKFISESVTDVIPVNDGVNATIVTIPCLEEIQQLITEEAAKHKKSIEEMEMFHASPNGKMPTVEIKQEEVSSGTEPAKT